MNSQLTEVATSGHSRSHAQLWMEKICGPHELDTQAGNDALNFHYQARRLPGLSCLFGDISYGAGVSIGVDGKNGLQSYSISLPTQGQQSLITSGCRIRSNPTHGLILSPDTFQQLDMEAQCEKQQLVIPASAVRSVAESLLSASLEQPLRFDPDMALDNPALGAWWQMVEQFMGQAGQIQALYGHTLLAKDLEIALIKGLLLAQPNSISNRLDRLGRTRQALPAYLVKACRFMRRHLAEDITIQAVSAAAGVSRFTLFSAFRDFLNTTPMAWQRHQRLDQVREVLLQGAAGLNVSAVALDWGFNHLGRFSSQYRERFGERPSDTLARSRTGFS